MHAQTFLSQTYAAMTWRQLQVFKSLSFADIQNVFSIKILTCK